MRRNLGSFYSVFTNSKEYYIIAFVLLVSFEYNLKAFPKKNRALHTSRIFNTPVREIVARTA